MDALEDVDRVVMIGGGDAEDVDGVDEAVDDSVPRFDANDELAAGGGEWVVTEGCDGVGGGVGGGRFRVVVLLVFWGVELLLFGGGEG